MDSRWTLEDVRNNGQLTAIEPYNGRGEGLATPNRFGPYKRVHRLMRGRYQFLIPLAIVAFVAGGIYGWHRSRPVYRGEALIQVANTLPKVIAPTDQNEPLDMFDEFVQSQVLLMSSRGVISLALEDPQLLKALGYRHDMNAESFGNALLVEHPPHSLVVDVTYIDPDPNVAAKAVQALVDAFLKVSGKSGNAEQDRRLAVLQDRKAALNQQIDAFKQELSQIDPPSILSIAMVDDMMRSLLQQKTSLEGQLDDFLATGFGEGRVQVKNVRARLDQVEKEIDDYQKDVAVMQSATSATPPNDRRVPILPKYLGYQEKIDALRTERDLIDQRIEVLTTESSLGEERFRVLSAGDIPAAPYTDRRPRSALMYGAAASCLPIGFFFLLGAANRRFRFSDDAAEIANTAPLLGVLPELPKDDGSPDLSKIAAYCVHNLRIRLQQLRGKESERVYMITSAAAGEGKTSLTMALGFSFAAAGKRVLLIDADTVGRGLTNRLKCEGYDGLLESVSGAGLAPVRQVMKNVSVLPAGNGGELGASAPMPLDELAEVIDSARRSFDLVIMDTGPVVASLQTPIVAQVADHVIMTISQGLQQVLCQRSMQILKSVGIKVTGVVFNRARERDYQRWVGGDAYYASSSTSKWNSPRQHGAGENMVGEYGPLAGSMAADGDAAANMAAANGGG